MAEKKYITSESQRRAVKKQEEKLDHLTIRVPKGTAAKVKAYVQKRNSEEPDNPMYASVNAYLIALIELESGMKIKNIMSNITLNDFLAMSDAQRQQYCEEYHIDCTIKPVERHDPSRDLKDNPVITVEIE